MHMPYNIMFIHLKSMVCLMDTDRSLAGAHVPSQIYVLHK